MKSWAAPLLVAAVAAGPLWAQQGASTNAGSAAKPSLSTTDLFPDTVVAKGKGVEVKRSQLDEEVTRFKSQAAGRGQAISADNTEKLEQYMLNQLIQVQLLEARATPADKADAKTEAEKRFSEAQTKLGVEELSRQLKLLGTSRDELVAKWTELSAADAVAKREVKATVTEADIKKYYEDNHSKFEQPEMVRASHILLGTQDPATREELPADKKAAKRKQAEDLLKRARAGEDFAKLAKAFSEDPGSKDRGGEYEFARGQMVKEFETAAFSLDTNQISDIVTTSYGYHIIKLSEKIPAKTAGLEDEIIVAPTGHVVLKQYWREPMDPAHPAEAASKVIRQTLEAQQFQKAMPEYIEKLKKDAGVEILDEHLKAKISADASSALPPGHPAIAPATAK
jgi:peptidyl-prolyl cis-trans isomerase C